ncbi:diguanylate cyclase [Piscinibacter sp. HJYY11]|uniref:sensor domain-containing diguanylate cyclase n=1 Tax=Piscinibacter sp. HJYY11 TaxID=2801333 RepID=UPI00191F1122|nr:diguanylate cyclase [Piscinibacter sp. HJYY11]MBL0731035.1 diguanylate cyclase [Piscinibacter sp. HJYY11]
MTRLSRCGCLLALLWWSMLGLALPVAAAPAEHVISADTRKIIVDSDVEYLVEKPGEALTRERVLQADMGPRWKVFPGKIVSLPGQRNPVWVRFTVRSAGVNLDRILSVDWPLNDEVRFSQFTPDTGAWRAEHVGGLQHPEAPQIHKDPNPIFPVELGAGERSVLLLRVTAQTSVIAPLVLWDLQTWQASRFDYAVVMGLVFGILGVMFFYNLSLYIFTRERSFRTYSGYLLAIIAYQLCVTGFGPLFIWPGNDWLNTRGYEFFAANSFLAATLFFRNFLDIGKSVPRHMDWINKAFVVFFTVSAVLLIFKMPVAVPLALSGVAFLTGFAGIYTAGYLVWKGNVLARYFVIAWATIIVATMLLLMALAGVIESGPWTKYAQPIGFVLETVLLSVALAERIKRERLSKEAALRESQELARKVELEREEKLRAQEHALTVQRKANEELELRVIDRTAELKRAMENVELANRELAKLSVTDGLTKVNNRRYFDETMKKEYDRSTRSGSPLALMLVDIDYFKKINDSVGHLGGDECLKLVASALASCVGRSTDLVARYGGEEFAVVLPGLDAPHAMEVAERIRKAVEDIQFIYRGRRVPVSVSLGVVARVAEADRPLSEFIREADQALYAAKGAGRNRAMLAEAA